MIQIAFSVFDSAASAYLPPFFVHSEKMAIRSFSDVVSNPEHQFAKHPEDYILHRLGIFDDNTGQFQPETPVKVLSALEVQPKAEVLPIMAKEQAE